MARYLQIGFHFAVSSLLLPAAFGQSPLTPDLVTPRSEEVTGFQGSRPYDPRWDLRTDFVMAYGIDDSLGDRLQKWTDAGYVPQVMTGVAWGNYQDYLDGEFDSIKHWDEGQVNFRGDNINHGPRVPYMVPSVAFSNYLGEGIKKAIDAGAVAVHLEEPEFWAACGYSEAFKREWKIYYRQPWRRPDSSVDAQYRASKLKYYLYTRTLDRICSAMKEYALAKYDREVRFYVPTHSLLNYAQWEIVSPESALLDLPGIDGYIAQIWTGTARTENVYHGIRKERTFETAYLEYGVMQELVRGTQRRMWFLHDPIEDNPRHDWTDYRENYIKTLVASLLHAGVWRYEICPWPARVYSGRFPRGRDGVKMPADYATTLAIVFNQLRDMQQADVEFGDAASEGVSEVGVFLSDSAMFQRANPALTENIAADSNDSTRPTKLEVEDLSGFYGLTLPLLKNGIPVRPVQLDNLLRTPGYLSGLKTLVLSYEFQKPVSPGLHQILAQWVAGGGQLIYVGADSDPFHAANDWWNTNSSPTDNSSSYATPTQHLFESMGLDRESPAGIYPMGKGSVSIQRIHPASLSRSKSNADGYRQIVRAAIERSGGVYRESNHLRMRRGPYLIAAVMDESIDAAVLPIRGTYIDLLDPNLPIVRSRDLQPGQQAWMLDLDRVGGADCLPLAAAGRITDWAAEGDRIEYHIASPESTQAITRLRLSSPPLEVMINGQVSVDHEWDPETATLLIRHRSGPEPTNITLQLSAK